ncbi:MAG: hypothetical protein U0637_10740 [Phycisphaerales bacterium]
MTPADRPAPGISTADAKRNLLQWSASTDRAIATKVHMTLAGIRGKTRRATPWIAGFAALAGVLMIALPSKPRDGAGERGHRAGSGILKTAATLVPVIMSLFAKR